MKSLWQILIPTVRPNTNCSNFFTTRYHKVWDKKVRQISGGLTICSPIKGQWVSPSGMLFTERMIPVILMASENELNEIMKMTASYYHQEAIIAWKISDKVILYSSGLKNNN